MSIRNRVLWLPYRLARYPAWDRFDMMVATVIFAIIVTATFFSALWLAMENQDGRDLVRTSMVLLVSFWAWTGMARLGNWITDHDIHHKVNTLFTAMENGGMTSDSYSWQERMALLRRLRDERNAMYEYGTDEGLLRAQKGYS